MSTPSDLERQARQLADSLTEALRPITEGIRAAVAPLTADPRLRAGAIQRELIRDQLREIVGFADEEDESPGAVAQNELAQERLDAILAFIDLAKAHSLPRKLLPRGDRVGDWLPPGTPVKIFGQHAAVVVDEPHRVLVNMAGYPHPVSFPRSAVAKEGEQWTPPKHTND